MKDNNQKIKVVIAINDMVVGGAQKLVVDQIKYFDKNRFDYFLFILAKFPGRKDFMNDLPKNLPIYQFNFKSFKSFGEWFKLFKVLNKIRPDVVRSSLFLTNTIIRVFKPFLGYKVVTTENNTHFNKSKAKILTDKLLSYLTYRIAPDSQTVTDFTIKQEKISPDKFMTIYNGIDIDEIKKYLSKPKKVNFKKEIGFFEDDKIILNIARFVPQKNQKLLIESFAKLAKQNNKYKLIVVGDGDLMPAIKKQVEDLGIEDKVYLPGLDKDLYRYYAISDVFVITSTQEGFCITAVMALAFGIPVVATKVAGLIEYIKDYQNGLLTSYDSLDISMKISEMINLNDEQRSIYYKNCQITAYNFDIKKHAKAFEDLFLASLNKK